MNKKALIPAVIIAEHSAIGLGHGMLYPLKVASLTKMEA